jgi:hypothetical protein
MDKELYDLKNWAITTLKEYKAELLIREQVTGKKPSQLKKLDRFLNALAVDTSGTYADMMDDARRKGISKEEFTKLGRNLEERIMNSFRVLPDDPAHHMYSLRSAGDLVQNVEPGVREMGLQILKDEGYILGNVRQNLTSLAEAAHQGRTGKGAELAALGELNIDKTKTNIAHPRGTGDPLISRTIDFKNIKTPEDFADAYRPLLEQQSSDFKRALETDNPRRIIIANEIEQRGGPSNIFSTDRTQGEVKAGRDIITKAPNVMQRAYQAMPIIEKGSFRLSFIPNLEEMGKAIARNPVGAAVGAASIIEPEAITSAFQGNYGKAAEQTTIGAGIGAGIQQVLKVNPMQQARLASYASKIPGVASQIPKALSIGAGVARFVGPAAMAVGGYQLVDAILEGSTGAGFVDTIKQVQDKERTAEINEAAVESAAKSKQLAVEKELPKPILDSDTIEKFVTDPLNELEYGWKKLTGQV